MKTVRRKLGLLLTMILVSTSSVAMAEDADAAEPSARPKSEEVRLQSGTWDDVLKQVDESVGKVVVVDIWSTSCRPCMEEFPHLVRLSKDLPEDVICISFNVDYAGIKSRPPEYFRERVTGFLQKSEAKLTNYLCTTDPDALFDKLNLPSIPAVFVYDAQGEFAKRFDSSVRSKDGDEPFTYEDNVVPYVRTLLLERRK